RQDVQLVLRKREDGHLVAEVVRALLVKRPGERALSAAAGTDQRQRRALASQNGGMKAHAATLMEQQAHETHLRVERPAFGLQDEEFAADDLQRRLSPEEGVNEQAAGGVGVRRESLPLRAGHQLVQSEAASATDQ